MLKRIIVSLLITLIFSTKLGSANRRYAPSFFSTIAGTISPCSTYACTNLRGFKQCAASEISPYRYYALRPQLARTPKALRIFRTLINQHPNCFSSFCEKVCSFPFSTEEEFDNPESMGPEIDDYSLSKSQNLNRGRSFSRTRARSQSKRALGSRQPLSYGRLYDEDSFDDPYEDDSFGSEDDFSSYSGGKTSYPIRSSRSYRGKSTSSSQSIGSYRSGFGPSMSRSGSSLSDRSRSETSYAYGSGYYDENSASNRMRPPQSDTGQSAQSVSDEVGPSRFGFIKRKANAASNWLLDKNNRRLRKSRRTQESKRNLSERICLSNTPEANQLKAFCSMCRPYMPYNYELLPSCQLSSDSELYESANFPQKSMSKRRATSIRRGANVRSSRAKERALRSTSPSLRGMSKSSTPSFRGVRSPGPIPQALLRGRSTSDTRSESLRERTLAKNLGVRPESRGSSGESSSSEDGEFEEESFWGSISGSR